MPDASPSPIEAAAAIAAVERFLADHSTDVAATSPSASGWLRNARLEAVEREPVLRLRHGVRFAHIAGELQR